MRRFILWVFVLILMIDNSALASELDHTRWYRNPWLYFIGLLMLLVAVIKILFDAKFVGTKGKTGLRKPLPPKRRRVVFSIYYREPSSKSIQFRGKVIERRSKERGNNFKDLLTKVKRDYAYRVIDPNGIFILASSHEKD